MNHREVMETRGGVELDIYANKNGMIILGCSAKSLGVTVHLSADEAEQFAAIIQRGVEAARRQREAA